MTIDEMLDQARVQFSTWRFVGDRVRTDTSERYCPLEAAARRSGVFNAVYRLNLSTTAALAVTLAADNQVTDLRFDPALRAKILSRLGLTEPA